MSWDIDKALVQTYKRNIEIKYQQQGSLLQGAVRVESQNAEFDFFDRITSVEATEVTTRHGDTPLIQTPHDRRRVALRDFDWADMIDKKDKLRMLADPTSSYTQNAIWALGRKRDSIIVEAAFGTAYTGKTGATPVTFPAAQTIAVNYVESGTAANSNLSIGKLRRTRYLMDKAEAINAGERKLFIACDPSQIQAMLRLNELTSSEYAEVKALVNGEINTFMGFTFIRYNSLPVATSIRSVLAWEQQGLLLSVANEVMVDVGPRRDKRNSVQVYVCGSFGATRMWEDKVIKILCDETV